MTLDLSALPEQDVLAAFYIGYFDRAPDPEGLEFWTNVADSVDFDLSDIATLFSADTEARETYPFFDNPTEETAGDFLTAVYTNLFGRTPDQAGIDFWTPFILDAVNGEDGAMSVGDIIIEIIGGAQDTDDGDDLTTILNKIDVALDWTASIEAAEIPFELDGASGDSARAAIEDVDGTPASVEAAKTATDAFVADNEPEVPGTMIFLEEGRDVVDGTGGNDMFEAFNGELEDGDRVNGGSGTDFLYYFNSVDGVAKTPITTGVEQFVITNQANDLNSVADNNVGGYSNSDDTVEVDVEIDAGRMNGVTRWENFDSRADVVIEDARDNDDTNGTFTRDITVAIVSTDPGNVDYAVYFDEPVSTSSNDDSIFIEVIDQNNSGAFSSSAITGSSTGNLEDAQLTEFSILVDGERVTVELDTDIVGTAHFGADATYTDLLNAINAGLDNTELADGSIAGVDLTATLGTPFSENIGDDNAGAGTNSNVFGLQIIIRSENGAELGDAGAGDIVVISREDPADTAQSITNAENIVEELITLGVELDDVGKSSMGGDAVFGAMSTGRQDGDDGTSDSIGIQQFNIEVDRSSQLQTISSTNNALEVVNIVNGENDGANNTTTAADEIIGDLVVRGVANPGTASDVATDSPMPGAAPQHTIYGFSDVRVINAASMVGAVDLTVGLTEEIVEKYLDIQDGASNGELDDVAVTYTLGTNDDEFFLNMSADALDAAGTGSREDFDLTIDGGAGDDVITTNTGESTKLIDEQGQDFYTMATQNGEAWYQNSVFTNASTFNVAGGSGNDTIWTHGWGDKVIADGSGMDAVYTDNSGVGDLSTLATNIDRNLLEHDQIDYVMGGVWALNAETTTGSDSVTRLANITGATNDNIVLATAPAGVTAANLSSGQATVTVFFTAPGLATTAATNGVYTTTATIPVTELSIVGANVVTTEQAYNQAIKNAINSDQTLSQVMEAADGPGNSLIVSTKIDGQYLGAEFDVAFTGLVVNGSSTAVTTARPAGYQVATDVEFTSVSAASITESDNIINVSADGENDVFVLSTNDSTVVTPSFDGSVADPLTDLDGSSNEELNFADGNFGSDTIINFQALGTGTAASSGTGFDVMDFLAISYSAGGGSNFGGGSAALNNNSISVIGETTANDTAAEVAALYNSAAATTSTQHIAIVFDVNDDNRGTVYEVNDTVGANATATLLGDIELIGTDWTALSYDNFA